MLNDSLRHKFEYLGIFFRTKNVFLKVVITTLITVEKYVLIEKISYAQIYSSKGTDNLAFDHLPLPTVNIYKGRRHNGDCQSRYIYVLKNCADKGKG